MSVKTVKVLDINRSYIFTSIDDGNMLYDVLVKHIMNKDQVIIDFKGIEKVTAGAVEYSIGKLFVKFDKKELEHIEFRNVPGYANSMIADEIKASIKKRTEYKKYIKEHPESKDWLDPLK